MHNLEGTMVEIGRVIHQRYLLQRLIQQGQACIVYQGLDQVLQRAVTIKVVPAQHISEYRTAIQLTSQFNHPNIVGIYDLIVEPDVLYIVQEYVDGRNFSALLQTQLSAFEVADLGVQVCRALLYAGTVARKVCHGDLTPASLLRDNRGLVRINNFAMPSDLNYFAAWNVLGGDGQVASDRELPWGQLSEGRRADDIRALGLLLYQLLCGKSPGTMVVEPPPDGRLRFMRNTPPELCNVVARSIVCQHPQRIVTADVLYTELKVIADALEPPPPTVVLTPLRQTDSFAPPQYKLAGANSGQLVNAMPGHDTTGLGAGYGTNSGLLEAPPAAATVADLSASMANAPQGAYAAAHISGALPEPASRPNLLLLFLLGLGLFGLFFAIGYYLSQMIFAH
ncbi:hypothetical protein EPA93_31435 [Ktedonosporobacter rubrisoli]|uniref:non-specific serine/threonine protein kinase n=1 Tax=Ktedonosporobacter rubrisoli TaxID=2509675 RepID=A0A4P6JWZ6_KTERU|nr:protein kinase [Ktedonosporobacter rubrisoli]QBD80249.1 hypothetical protein EPA93_31435 [Ktedonosporobacter rubrisoli]